MKLEESKGKRWLTIECFKNRKGKKFKPILMELKEAITRDGLTLAVYDAITLLDLPAAAVDGVDEVKLEKALSVFRTHFVEKGANLTTWMKAIQKDTGTADGWSRRTCERLFARLIEDGKVKGGGGRGEVYVWGPMGDDGLRAGAPPRGGAMPVNVHGAKNGVAPGVPVPVGTIEQLDECASSGLIVQNGAIPDVRPEPGQLLQGELANAIAMMQSEPSKETENDDA
jgi:hypothetical protein